MGKEQFIGTWKLVSCEAVRGNGDVVKPLGDSPKGVLMYDANGNMSAQLFPSDRHDFASEDQTAASDSEIRSAFLSFSAYYGTYSVNDDNDVVTHHVEGALVPNRVGSDQLRNFKLDGDKLTLSPPPREVDGQTQVSSLEWHRVR
jgi:hypothetical protein